MAYRTTIVEVGPEAKSFLAEKMAITFGDDAPAALRDYCYRIAPAELDGPLQLGGTVRIGQQEWTITAIGEVAEKNLGAMGHVTLVLDGATEPRMPGAVHLSGPDEDPDLHEGGELVFL